MYMLLILNATSIQLIPTTVLALRAAAGSVDAGAIVLPSLVWHSRIHGGGRGAGADLPPKKGGAPCLAG